MEFLFAFTLNVSAYCFIQTSCVMSFLLPFMSCTFTRRSPLRTSKPIMHNYDNQNLECELHSLHKQTGL